MASPSQRLPLAAAGKPRRVLEVKRPAGVSLVTLLLVGAVGAWIAYGTVNDSCDVPVVSPSPASDASAWGKVQAYSDARAQAQRTGTPVSIAETFDDSELTSLVNDYAESRFLNVRAISLRATRRGTLDGCGHGELVSGLRPGSFRFEGVPVVGNGRVAVQVTSTHVSALPGPLSASATQRLRQLLTQGLPISSLEQVHVAVTDGRLTLTAVAR
jgi:hypothetical protein